MIKGHGAGRCMWWGDNQRARGSNYGAESLDGGIKTGPPIKKSPPYGLIGKVSFYGSRECFGEGEGAREGEGEGTGEQP